MFAKGRAGFCKHSRMRRAREKLGIERLFDAREASAYD